MCIADSLIKFIAHQIWLNYKVIKREKHQIDITKSRFRSTFLFDSTELFFFQKLQVFLQMFTHLQMFIAVQKWHECI